VAILLVDHDFYSTSGNGSVCCMKLLIISNRRRLNGMCYETIFYFNKLFCIIVQC